MIELKSKEEIENIRKAGKIVATALKELEEFIKPNITPFEINNEALKIIQSHAGRPAFRGYRPQGYSHSIGFPADICISVNEEVVHGLPDEDPLTMGDIVSLDIGVELGGYFADAAITIPIGKINGKIKRLLEVTQRALNFGIKVAKVDAQVSDISSAIQSLVEAQGFSVVRDFCGHGIGKRLHEEPEIPNFGQPHRGPLLKSGMVLAIEPMVNMGSWEVRISPNRWTALTKDGKPSAHFEHTIAITEDGPLILTR